MLYNLCGKKHPPLSTVQATQILLLVSRNTWCNLVCVCTRAAEGDSLQHEHWRNWLAVTIKLCGNWKAGLQDSSPFLSAWAGHCFGAWAGLETATGEKHPPPLTKLSHNPSLLCSLSLRLPLCDSSWWALSFLSAPSLPSHPSSGSLPLFSPLRIYPKRILWTLNFTVNFSFF